MVLQAINYQPASGSSPPVLDILDQLLLPHESTYIGLKSCEEAHDAIKKMQVRGAPAIAIVAALALAVEVGTQLIQGTTPQNAEESRQSIGKRLEYLKTSRPTAVNLGDAVAKLKIVVKRAALQEGAGGKAVANQYIQAAEQMLIDDVADNKAIGEHGARWIQNNTSAGQKGHALKVLTHCNTGSLATAGYGTALGVVRSLREAEILEHVFCTETRPYNQGSRLTAYELVHGQIPATLVTDSMAASLLLREGDKLAAVVVGADRVAANGDTANKIGTYSLAVLARHHGVKFLVAAPRTTIDLHTASGKDIVIEQRVADEVTRLRGPSVGADGSVQVDKPVTVSVAATGIDVWNPAFDVTPSDLIDGVVTEVGVVEKVNGCFDFAPLFSRSGTGQDKVVSHESRSNG